MNLKLFAIGILIFTSCLLNAAEPKDSSNDSKAYCAPASYHPEFDNEDMSQEKYCQELEKYASNKLEDFTFHEKDRTSLCTNNSIMSMFARLANESNKCQLTKLQYNLSQAIQYCEYRKKMIAQAEQKNENRKEYLHIISRK